MTKHNTLAEYVIDPVLEIAGELGVPCLIDRLGIYAGISASPGDNEPNGLVFIYSDTKNARKLKFGQRFLWRQMADMVFCYAIVADFIRLQAIWRRVSHSQLAIGDLPHCSSVIVYGIRFHFKSDLRSSVLSDISLRILRMSLRVLCLLLIRFLFSTPPGWMSGVDSE